MGRIEQEAVDGEIAALDVFRGGLGVTNFIGVAAIGVDAVIAEGGDLGHHLRRGRRLLRGRRRISFRSRSDEDDAEVCSNRVGARKHGKYNVGSGGGCDVVVLRLATEEEIANATTGEVSIVSR